MKKTYRLIISLFMICCIIAPISVFATDTPTLDVVVSLQIDNPLMEVNGSQTEIDAGRGTTPIVNNGRTLVPIRAIIEAFGGTVSWNNVTRMVTLEIGRASCRERV